MKRRDFMTLTTRLAAAAALPASLYGCGSSAVENPRAGTTSVDAAVSDTNAQQSSTDDQNSTTQDTNQTVASYIAGLFDFSYSHYLSVSSSATLMQMMVAANADAYTDYQNQLAKLLAIFRVFDNENPNSTLAGDEQLGEAASAAQSLAFDQIDNFINANEDTDEADQASAIQSFFQLLYSYIADGSIGQWIIEKGLDPVLKVVTTSLNVIIGFMENIGSSVLALAIQFLTQNTMEAFITEMTQNLTFDSKSETIISLSKMTIAAVSVLAMNKLENSVSTTEPDFEFMSTYLTSSDLMAQMALMWLNLSNQVVANTVTTTTEQLAEVESIVSTQEEDENGEILVGGDAVAAMNLKADAALLALSAYTIKYLLSVFSEQAVDDSTGSQVETGFAPQSTASAYSTLFTTTQSDADQALSAHIYQNSDVSAQADANLDAFVNYMNAPEREDQQADLSEAVSAIQALNAQTLTTVTPEAAEATAQAESTNFYDFILALASQPGEFAAGTRDTAAQFATDLATLAYNFTMKIEDDAYNFAMQGMEYGYLFASRGEEVGIMADRILWMAVQIGVMADRIGEMADRIVYTEQLIVYTEILILDFGILIYGVIKQITNLILTGMALILDREWYSPDSEDIILSTIDKNVTTMLNNMNEYSLAVLDNQVALRESTQSVIDTIGVNTAPAA